MSSRSLPRQSRQVLTLIDTNTQIMGPPPSHSIIVVKRSTSCTSSNRRASFFVGGGDSIGDLTPPSHRTDFKSGLTIHISAPSSPVDSMTSIRTQSSDSRGGSKAPTTGIRKATINRSKACRNLVKLCEELQCLGRCGHKTEHSR